MPSRDKAFRSAELLLRDAGGYLEAIEMIKAKYDNPSTVYDKITSLKIHLSDSTLRKSKNYYLLVATLTQEYVEAKAARNKYYDERRYLKSVIILPWPKIIENRDMYLNDTKAEWLIKLALLWLTESPPLRIGALYNTMWKDDKKNNYMNKLGTLFKLRTHKNVMTKGPRFITYDKDTRFGKAYRSCRVKIYKSKVSRGLIWGERKQPAFSKCLKDILGVDNRILRISYTTWRLKTAPDKERHKVAMELCKSMDHSLMTLSRHYDAC